MCYGCWTEYGEPKIENEKVRLGAKLVEKLYETEFAGGMLHVQLDDWNIEDDLWEDPFKEYLIELHERQPLAVEREIALLFREMTLDERASCLALADGYWTEEEALTDRRDRT